MTDLDKVNTWVKSLLNGLPETTQAELRSIVSKEMAPPPTGDQVKVLIFHHVINLARKNALADDPFTIADAIREGQLRLEA